MKSPARTDSPIGIWLLGGLLIVTLAALSFGAVQLSFHKLLSAQTLSIEHTVLWHIRLPRVLLCILVGGALGYAGAAIQGLFRNPLAEPSLIGVAAGASLGVGLFVVFFAEVVQGYLGLYGMNTFAFGGAFISSMLVLRVVDRWASGSVMVLLLVGLAFNAIASAGSSLLTYFSNDEQLRTLTFWAMGSFGSAIWSNVLVSATLIVPATLWLRRFAMPLNLIQLGERDMAYSGVDPRRVKRHVILCTAVLVGAAVAAAGMIGFVGLMIPHLIRLLVGAEHRKLLPLSFIAGGLLMVVADTLARTLIAPSEMPVGVLTSVLGGPFFLWLLYQQLGRLNR